MKNKGADGLRGIAAFNRCISHFIAAFLPMMLHNNFPMIFPQNNNSTVTFEVITSPFLSVFYNGQFAVLIFLVLSGYVLTIPSFKDNTEGLLQKRLWGRYLRLNIPIAATITLSLIAYKLGFYSNIQAAEISGSTNWLSVYFPAGISYAEAFKELLLQSIFLGERDSLSATLATKIYIYRFNLCFAFLYFDITSKDNTSVNYCLFFIVCYAWN